MLLISFHCDQHLVRTDRTYQLRRKVLRVECVASLEDELVHDGGQLLLEQRGGADLLLGCMGLP